MSNNAATIQRHKMKKQDMDIVTYTIVKGASAKSKVPQSVPTADHALNLGTIVARIRDKEGNQFKLRSRIILPCDNWSRGTISMPRKGAKGYELTAAAKSDFADWSVRLESICRLLPDRTTENVREAMDATADLNAEDVAALTADQLGKMLQWSDAAQGMGAVLRDYAENGMAKHKNEYQPLAPSTKKIVLTLAGAFDRYEAAHGQVTLATLNADKIQDFQSFLATEEPQEGKGRQRTGNRAVNSVSAMMGKLRTALKFIAKKYGVSLPHDIFTDILTQDYKQEPIYLNTEELNQLAAYRCDRPKQDNVRRAFIFQCLTGMRFGDLAALRSICKDEDGNPFIHYVANKTGEEAKVPLTPLALEQLNAEGAILDVPSLPTYNAAIKEIMETAGIKRMVPILAGKTINYEPICKHGSSHMARRTFVGRLINTDVSAEVVRSMSGHAEGSKAFARYYAITDAQKRKALATL